MPDIINSDNMYSREIRLIGKPALEKLKSSRIMLCGLGGVGGGALEALVRAGVGELVLVDKDVVDETNLNRQLIATRAVIGESKTSAAKKRVLEIRPDADVTCVDCFISPENAEGLLSEYKPDYVIDAIDNVSAKIALAVLCEKLNIPLVSSMGTGNKLDPTQLCISDIYKTDVCPLARVMRRELKARGVKALKVVWSPEVPIRPEDGNLRTPASISFVPPVAGMLLAGEVVCDLIGRKNKR